MKVFLTVFTLMSCLAFAKSNTFSEEQLKIQKVSSCGCTDCKCTPQNHCGCKAKPAPRCDCRGPSCPCNNDPGGDYDDGDDSDYDDDKDTDDDKDDDETQRQSARSRW